MWHFMGRQIRNHIKDIQKEGVINGVRDIKPHLKEMHLNNKTEERDQNVLHVEASTIL